MPPGPGVAPLGSPQRRSPTGTLDRPGGVLLYNRGDENTFSQKSRRFPAAGQATEFFENETKVFGNSPRDARNMGAMMVMETDHETAQYAWDYRCRVIDCSALLASMVAKECAALA